MPLPGESFDGYLAYRAAHAHMPGPFAFAELGGATYAQYPQIAYAGLHDEDLLREVADALGIEVGTLRRMSHEEVGPGRRRFIGTSLGGALLEKRSRRFSPASLAESPHHRALWSVRCLPFCDESWELLLDACPVPYCGAVQRWRLSSGPERCDQCGSPLASARADLVAEGDREPLRMLSGLLHHDQARVAESLSSLPPVLRAVPPGGLIEIACALAVVHDPTVRGRSTRRPDTRANRFHIVRAMAEAARLLRGWPGSGERLAAERLARRDGRFGDGNDGATLNFLSTARGDGRGDAVAEAAGMLVRALRGNARDGVPIGRSVAGTGLTVSEMAQLRRAGEVDTVFHLVRDRIVPLISRTSLERLREDRGRGVSIRSAATALGITSNGVEQMLLKGLLVPAGLAARPPFGPATYVNAGSLRRLIERIVDGGTARPDASWIGLATAAAGMGGDLKPWATWFEWMLDGTVGYAIGSKAGGASHRILISTSVAEAVRSTSFDDDGPFHPFMSRMDAISTLNIHRRHVRKAFEPWPRSTELLPDIPLHEVRLIATNRIACSELGAALGCAAVKLPHAARARKLEANHFGYERELALKRFGLA